MKRPNRGEIWIVDLGMAAVVRPCLVLSVALADKDRVLTTVIPPTTSVQGTRFEVQKALKFLKPGVFDAHNVATIPCTRFVRQIGSLQADQLAPIEVAVRQWLGL